MPCFAVVLLALLNLVSAAPPLQLELLPDALSKERGAQCLDHSPAGYYIREQDPKKWVIFLEGGGLCIELIDCLQRRKSNLGSSKYWDPHTPPEGLMTTSVSALNPFANYSHVWVPYCSGDTWAGSSAKGHAALAGMQMSGHLIIDTIVDRLLNTTQFGSATDIVLSGTSAGGIGTFHHIDWLADKMSAYSANRKQTPAKVVGVPIEGLFFPEKWPVLFEEFIVGRTSSIANFASKYLSFVQEPWFPPACVEASEKAGFDRRECFDVSRMLPYVKTPLFIGMNRFDSLEIGTLGACLKCKSTDDARGLHGKFIRLYGARMNQTILDTQRVLPRTGWFVPSVFHHDENFYMHFESKEKKIAGKSLREAIEQWQEQVESVVLLEPTCNDDGPCVQFSDCHEVGGEYVDASSHEVVTVEQAGCEAAVQLDGQSLAGQVLGRKFTIPIFQSRGNVQANGDIRWALGRTWKKRSSKLFV